ncbi:MAG TPA: DUF192 domain-containing protein [Gemmatimonadaceae bacterium]|nr:DUF192 domain-containing protein [Gemmatimonadaceae bacterium]
MRTFFSAILLALGVVACNEKAAYSGDERILPFDSVEVRLVSARDTTTIRVELALSREQKTLGLMERRRLPENAGMLFVYDSTQGPEAGFWMYRTRIPLDIAFIDSAGVIRSILAMVPCETTIPEGCPSYVPNGPYRYALEVNAGFFQRHQISVGDTLLLGDIAPRPNR